MRPAIANQQPARENASPAFPEPFRFIKPTLPPLREVISIYRAAYNNGLITNADIVARFEHACNERVGVRHSVAVSSCTSGLALVIKALALRGEVIVPSMTFFATAHAVAWNGLQPVFADCDPHTWTLDPDDVERRITAKTSAIIGVHLYGNPCDVERLELVARSHGLKLLFDSAHAFGSRHRGREIGTFGDAEVFSLSPTKLLVAGEGGLVATNDETLARRLRAARNYGDNGTYDPEVLGLNARMSEFNASLALAGLSLIDSKIKKHNDIARLYTSELSSLPGLRFQTVHPHDVSTYKDYCFCVEPELFGMSRDVLEKALLAENIITRKYFYPAVHNQKLYRDGRDRNDLRNSDGVAEQVLSLPIYESLSYESVSTIVSAIRRCAALARA